MKCVCILIRYRRGFNLVRHIGAIFWILLSAGIFCLLFFASFHPWGLKEVNRKLLTLMLVGSKASFQIQEATSIFSKEATDIDVSRKWHFLFKKGSAFQKNNKKGEPFFNFCSPFHFFSLLSFPFPILQSSPFFFKYTFFIFLSQPRVRHLGDLHLSPKFFQHAIYWHLRTPQEQHRVLGILSPYVVNPAESLKSSCILSASSISCRQSLSGVVELGSMLQSEPTSSLCSLSLSACSSESRPSLQLPPNREDDDWGPCGSTRRPSPALLSCVQVVVDAYTIWKWS